MSAVVGKAALLEERASEFETASRQCAFAEGDAVVYGSDADDVSARVLGERAESARRAEVAASCALRAAAFEFVIEQIDLALPRTGMDVRHLLVALAARLA